MAEKKITEVQALGIVRALVEDYVTDGAEFEDSEFTPAEVVEKLDKMIATRSKKRERKSDNSKTLANITLGEKFAAEFTGETFKAKDVAEALGVSTPKASAICKAMNWAKIPTTDKTATYSLEVVAE